MKFGDDILPHPDPPYEGEVRAVNTRASIISDGDIKEIHGYYMEQYHNGSWRRITILDAPPTVIDRRKEKN